MRIPLRGSVGRGGGGRLLYFSWEVGEAKRVFLFHRLLNHFSVDWLRFAGLLAWSAKLGGGGGKFEGLSASGGFPLCSGGGDGGALGSKSSSSDFCCI